MRGMIVAAVWAAAATALLATAAGARTLDLANPADALAASRKVQCSLKDNTPVVYHWSGKVFSRVDGEPDRHLFDLEGMNVRQCTTIVDPARGTGWRQVSRELMFYLDPATHAVLKTWTNPWTQKSVEVVHVANDPVNSRPSFPVARDGKSYDLGARVENGRVFMPTEVPLFYQNALGGDYQTFAGNQYHAMEIFDFVADAKDLLDGTKDRANASIAWVRISPWLPWMEMSGRNGILVFNATGQTLPDGIAGLPAVIREQIAANYPIYAAPPPTDDARPNETSWTYFKKRADAAKAGAPKP